MLTEDITFIASCDGTEQRYIQVLPEGVENETAHDILIVLHGHGADRWQYVKDPRDECQSERDVAAEYDMIYISPDFRASTSWMGAKAESDILDIIAKLKTNHKVARIFLCGGSMGGTASLTFAALHPELLAGVVAMNGVANLLEYENFQDAIVESFGGTKIEKIEEYRKRSAELHTDQLTMPLGLTTSGNDSSTPADSVLRMAKTLKHQNKCVLLIHRDKEGHRTNYDDATAILQFVLKNANNIKEIK